MAGVAFGSLAALLNGGWGGDPEAGSLESSLRTATMPVGDVLSVLFFIVMIVSFVIGAALVHRFLRSQGVERNQIKWVALAGACVAAILSLLLILFGLEAVDETWGGCCSSPGWWRYRPRSPSPCSAIASARSTGCCRGPSAMWWSSACSPRYMWSARCGCPTRLLGEETPLFVAASTLTVAGLFGPLRRRVMVWVDRRFYRARYDADRVADAFSSRLRDQIDLTDLTSDWVEVATATLRPATIGVWVSERVPD